jgi:hypothetical protein
MEFGQTVLSNQIPRNALSKCANSWNNEGKNKFKN